MRKRLRKKKHLGEFTAFGFELSFDYECRGIEEHNELMDAFIREAIEANGLQFGGGDDGSHGRWAGFAAAHAKYGSATDEHREKVRVWLEQRPEVTAIRIGPLRDAWNGW